MQVKILTARGTDPQKLAQDLSCLHEGVGLNWLVGGFTFKTDYSIMFVLQELDRFGHELSDLREISFTEMANG
jgi:hypothetical protein